MYPVIKCDCSTKICKYVLWLQVFDSINTYKNKKGVTFVTPFSIMNCINSYFPSPESLSLKAASPSISPKVVFSAEVDVI